MFAVVNKQTPNDNDSISVFKVWQTVTSLCCKVCSLVPGWSANYSSGGWEEGGGRREEGKEGGRRRRREGGVGGGRGAQPAN